MLGTGALGMDIESVANRVVPAALRVADQLGLAELVFLASNRSDGAALEYAVGSSWARRGGLDDPLESTDLAGGVSTDWVDPNAGIPLANDQLGVTPYVSMLATVIADRKTQTPLSIGVFGEWGAGKSYFMGMLRAEISSLADHGGPAYCSAVRQIGFNAWHYADTNLWASLGDEIFRQLADTGSTVEDQRTQLMADLAKKLDRRQELDNTVKQAQTAAARLQADVDSAREKREFRVGKLLEALGESPDFQRQLDELSSKLGLPRAEQARLVGDELRGTLTDAQALRRTSRDRTGKLALATAVFFLVVCAVIAAFAPDIRTWLAGTGAVLLACSGLALRVVVRARSGLQSLRRIADDVRAKLADSTPEVEALRQAEAERRLAEARLTDLVTHIGELGRQLAELMPGQRLYSFLAVKAGDDAYAAKLGLISMIRKDFQQLVELVEDWRHNEDSQGPAPIERIVLYIDDLDRCGPDQVVAVLQAVHLLLALDLFVVVIGVDPRWLLRALRSHYDQILEDDHEALHPPNWHVTPDDYLEKIINIPVVLPGMAEGSLVRLLRWLADDAPAAPLGPVARLPPIGDALTVEVDSEVDRHYSAASGGSPSAPPRPLTEPELTMLASLDVLIGTPREAKRLFNLYRMVRSTRDLTDASRFLGDDGRPGEYQAVIVLLGMLTGHARLLKKVLDTPPDERTGAAGGLMRRGPATSWDAFVDDLRPADGANRMFGALTESFACDLARLHGGLVKVSEHVTLADLRHFQSWAPRIRRFSYSLSRSADVAP
jgi:hypothetical protein